MLTLEQITNKIIQGDSAEVLGVFPSNIIDLTVTSPPYNTGMEYENTLSDEDWIAQMQEILSLILEASKSDGRLCWNVSGTVFRGNNNRDFFDLLGASKDAIKAAGWKHRETIVWDQINAGCETAWGSWKSASAPFLRHQCEFILVAYKDVWKKQTPGESTISESEFMTYTHDKWRFSAQTSNRKHPAPFPKELVYRCLQLFSYKNDVVLDPFLGSGTTAVVCSDQDRQYIGIEKEKRYIDLALPKMEYYEGRKLW